MANEERESITSVYMHTSDQVHKGNVKHQHKHTHKHVLTGKKYEESTKVIVYIHNALYLCCDQDQWFPDGDHCQLTVFAKHCFQKYVKNMSPSALNGQEAKEKTDTGF